MDMFGSEFGLDIPEGYKNFEIFQVDYLQSLTEYEFTEDKIDLLPQMDLGPIMVVENTSSTATVYSPSVSENIKVFNTTMKPILNQVEQKCLGLLPLIKRATPQNYCMLLVETLRICSNQIPLKEFYNLLYNSSIPHAVPAHETLLKQNACIGEKSEAVGICSFIFQTFSLSKKGSESVLFDSVKNPQLSRVNYDEFCRNFFALKFIFDCIEVDDTFLHHSTIPRISIYNAYRMICEEYPKRFKFVSKSSKSPKKTVGLPQFGRLIRLVYPNLKIRRLGRRGLSRYHYIGIVWNQSIIDAEMMKELELDLASINSGKQLQKDDESSVSDKKKEQDIKISETVSETKKPCFQVMSNKLCSFAQGSSQVPDSEFLPRDWNCLQGRIPQQSIWAHQNIAKSGMALRKYKIDIQPIVDDFHIDIFSPEYSNIFSAKFIHLIKVLIANNADEQGYMHFYLIVLLLTLPVILASEKEVPCAAKVKLRQNLNSFITQLKSEVFNLPENKLSHLYNFSNLIRRITHINEMSSAHVETKLIKDIVQDIARDIYAPNGDQLSSDGKTSTEENIFRAVVTALNAFKSGASVDDKYQDFTGNTEFILHVVHKFMDFSINVSERILKIPVSMSSEDLQHTKFDLPFQIFMVSVRLLHDICFTDPFVSKLSIQVIGYILHLINKELKFLSFRKFSKRDNELSKSIFKTLWVYSALLGEYMKVLGELVALSERLC